MQLNAKDGGNRKFIMVQLPERTDEKDEAYKAGYKNICEIGKERIHRVCKACDGIAHFVLLYLLCRLIREHRRDLFLRGSFFGFILSLRFFLVCGRLGVYLCCRCRCGLGLGHGIAVVKERYLILRYLRRPLS